MILVVMGKLTLGYDLRGFKFQHQFISAGLNRIGVDWFNVVVVYDGRPVVAVDGCRY